MNYVTINETRNVLTDYTKRVKTHVIDEMITEDWFKFMPWNNIFEDLVEVLYRTGVGEIAAACILHPIMVKASDEIVSEVLSVGTLEIRPDLPRYLLVYVNWGTGDFMIPVDTVDLWKDIHSPTWSVFEELFFNFWVATVIPDDHRHIDVTNSLRSSMIKQILKAKDITGEISLAVALRLQEFVDLIVPGDPELPKRTVFTVINL